MSKAFSKSKMNVSTCPPLSKIIAQPSAEFHSYAFCLSDKNLCSSKCAIIFEQTICSSNLHGTQVRETDR